MAVMDEAAGRLHDALDTRLGRRGWRFRRDGETVTGRVADWPRQLSLVADPGAASRPPGLGLALRFDAMPLGGERFRDILNADREEMLGAYGSFRVRQLLDDGRWASELGHRAFLHGYGSGSGISRRAALAVFDRCPEERGEALAERVVADLPRLAETGTVLAATLQRVYQRTVLTAEAEPEPLPDVVGSTTATVGAALAGTALVLDGAYPWRR